MFSTVLSAALQGLQVEFIDVEADLSNGLPMFHMVGYLSSEVKEAGERVRTAIRNSGLVIPAKKIVVNLSPADVRKRGTAFDLPIAVSILASLGVVSQERLEKTVFVGELSLDGRVRSVPGILPIVLEAKKHGFQSCVVSKENESEGKLVEGIEVIGVENLKAACDVLNEGVAADPTETRTVRDAGEHTYELDYQDIKGQKLAKRAAEVAVAGNHNMLMIGPTGSGKTYLVQTLAKLLDVPLAITDATSLTEAGYIGDDIESVVSKLLAAADNDVERAEHGIIFIDEIDKIAKKKNTNQRDVSGESVQQGMLKLLEGSDVEVPVGANSKNAMVPLTTVNTKNILFICGGAFPDLEQIIKERLNKQASMGFIADLKDKYNNDKDILSKVTVEDIRNFGMIPEFIGRLPIIFTLQGLDEDMLVKILKEPKNAILKQYQKLLELDEVKLNFDEEALHAIARKAMKKDTGARALRSIIEEFMLDIMYEIPKDDNIGQVTITKEYIEGTGGPLIAMRGQELITG